MKVKEWIERNGLSLEDEIPSAIAGPELFVSEAFTEGLSKEDAERVRTLAKDCSDSEKVEMYARWLKAGDVGMYDIGVTPFEAMQKIESNLSSIRRHEGLVPFNPNEFFSFKISLVNYAVIMRFTKAENE